MSLQVKLIAALMATGLLSVAVVWGVAHERLTRRFDELVQMRSARNFRGDVAAYWQTYGSWDAGRRVEPFIEFVERRKALVAGAARFADTGDAADARPLPPLAGLQADAGQRGTGDPSLRPRRRAGGDSRRAGFFPLFRFLLFDPAGRVLNPVDPEHPEGRSATADERAGALPIEVAGQVVAYASPIGAINYSDTDRAYLAAMQNALLWGIGAAAVMAVGLGLLAGRQLSRSLRGLTRAIGGIRDGVLRQRVEIAGRDEVAVLARAFNQMSDELARSTEALQASHAKISEQAEQLRLLAICDPLTQLFNRRHFADVAGQLYEQAARYGRPLTVAIGDIDFFKRINDRFSHATGDAVLRAVAGLLRGQARAADLVARYGGEEFVLAFPETGPAEAAELCERLRRRIEAHSWAEIHPDLQVTISLGLCADLGLGSVDAMLDAADAELYRAKAEGRNRVCRAGVAAPVA